MGLTKPCFQMPEYWFCGDVNDAVFCVEVDDAL